MIIEKVGRFDPRNEKYKSAKFEDLPKIMQEDHAVAEGGGFISKETAAEQEMMADMAKKRTSKDR